MRICGITLFTLGVIIAISGAAKLPAPVEPEISPAAGDEVRAPIFPDTWPICVLGICCGVAGVVMWRWGLPAVDRDRAERADDGRSTNGETNPAERLLGTVHAANRLESEIDKIHGDRLLAALDALLEQHLLPLADVRQRVLGHFGMSTGAEILVALAFGERMVNRAWSAAADGYPAEARRSCREAVQAIRHAEDLWRQAEDERS